jgi:hypothetical protein
LEKEPMTWRMATAIYVQGGAPCVQRRTPSRFMR